MDVGRIGIEDTFVLSIYNLLLLFFIFVFMVACAHAGLWCKFGLEFDVIMLLAFFLFILL